MEKKLQVGDKVRVMDQGLLMLQKFAPPNAIPNNEGVVLEIMGDGYLKIEFPLEGEGHSQVAFYHEGICHLIP